VKNKHKKKQRKKREIRCRVNTPKNHKKRHRANTTKKKKKKKKKKKFFWRGGGKKKRNFVPGPSPEARLSFIHPIQKKSLNWSFSSIPYW
jgi:hypothetical protein